MEAAKDSRQLACCESKIRTDLVLLTKVTGFQKRSYIPSARAISSGSQSYSPTTHSREQLFSACNASLVRLQTDFIDVFLLHWPDRYVPMYNSTVYNTSRVRDDSVEFDEIVSTMGALVDLGKI